MQGPAHRVQGQELRVKSATTFLFTVSAVGWSGGGGRVGGGGVDSGFGFRVEANPKPPKKNQTPRTPSREWMSSNCGRLYRAEREPGG